MTMMVVSALPKTSPERLMKYSQINRKRRGRFLLFAQGELHNKNVSSAEGFLLARESVVRFVEDSIANAVDWQKCNDNKYRRENVISYIESDLFLLSTVNLTGDAVTNVGSSK